MIGSICIHPPFTFHLPLYRRSVHLQCAPLTLDLTIAPLVCFIFASLPSTRFPSSEIIDIAAVQHIIALKERDRDFLNFNFFKHLETTDTFIKSSTFFSHTNPDEVLGEKKNGFFKIRMENACAVRWYGVDRFH